MTLTPKAVTPSGARTLRNPYASPNSSTCPNAWPTVLEPIRLASIVSTGRYRRGRAKARRAEVGVASAALAYPGDGDLPTRSGRIGPMRAPNIVAVVALGGAAARPSLRTR